MLMEVQVLLPAQTKVRYGVVVELVYTADSIRVAYTEMHKVEHR